MYILQYNLTTTTKAGGVETFVWELSRELAGRGHAVTILGGAPRQGDKETRRQGDQETRRPGDQETRRPGEIPLSGLGSWVSGLVSPSLVSPSLGSPAVRVLRAPFIDRRAFQKLPPLRRMYVLVKLLERVSMMPAALPLLRGFDIVHLHKPYDLLLAPLLARWGAKVVLHSHGEDFFRGDRLLARSVSAILSCSRFNAGYTGERFGRSPVVVYNGYDAERFVPLAPDPQLRAELLPRGGRALLCVARLIPWKGVGDLIAALALLPDDVTLLVAGTGHERVNLEHQALAAGLADRVRFLGDVPHRALPPLFALADVAVGASYASETFGMALVEAMGCARPVVATRFGGFPEVVVEGSTGLLVPPRDPQAMAAALRSLLDDPLRRIRLGANGRARALRLFTWPAVADRVETAYAEVSGAELVSAER